MSWEKQEGAGVGAAPLRGALLARRFFFEDARAGKVRAREAFLRPHPSSCALNTRARGSGLGLGLGLGAGARLLLYC